jgi:hypothetical protein
MIERILTALTTLFVIASAICILDAVASALTK